MLGYDLKIACAYRFIIDGEKRKTCATDLARVYKLYYIRYCYDS